MTSSAPDVKREMFHRVHGVCFMTPETMELDSKSDDITRTYVQLDGGDIIEVDRAMLTRNYSGKMSV